jgi:hypothetical protein
MGFNCFDSDWEAGRFAVEVSTWECAGDFNCERDAVGIRYARDPSPEDQKVRAIRGENDGSTSCSTNSLQIHKIKQVSNAYVHTKGRCNNGK